MIGNFTAARSVHLHVWAFLGIAILLTGCSGEDATNGLASSQNSSDSNVVASNPPVVEDSDTSASPDESMADGGTGEVADPLEPLPAVERTEDKRQIPERTFQLNDLDRVMVEIDGHQFKTWVMDTFPKMQEGLMFVQDRDMAEGEAMVFVYPQATQLNFWMKNTVIPLDIAYLSSDRRIVNIHTMQALDTRPNRYPSRGPAKYAIEFKAGTLEKLGIEPGMAVRMPETVRFRP